MNGSSLLNKRNLLLLIVFVSMISVFAFVFSSINSQQTIAVKYKNISKVTIQKIGEGSRTLEKETIYKESGEKIKVSKGRYLLKYTGSDGYASDYENFDVANKPVYISLNPDYSDQRLSSILEGEFENIKTVLSTKYQNIGDYNIQKGKLYKKGQWYATTLQYDGDDMFNYDTLRLVMEKRGGVWQLVTDPPNIILGSKNYPNIPIDILRDVNNVQNTPFVEKYVDSNSKAYFP